MGQTCTKLRDICCRADTRSEIDESKLPKPFRNPHDNEDTYDDSPSMNQSIYIYIYTQEILTN